MKGLFGFLEQRKFGVGRKVMYYDDKAWRS